MAKGEARTPERRKAILQFLAAGNTRRAAAIASGIGVTTFYEWLADDEEFAEEVARAEAAAEGAAVARIMKASEENWTAAAWFLERKRPEEWGRRDRIDAYIRHEEAPPIATDEELVRIRALIDELDALGSEPLIDRLANHQPVGENAGE